MPVQCQHCGNVQPSGRYCPSCGGQMMPQEQVAASAMPSPPLPGYPGQGYTQPPKASGGKGWVLWTAIGGGVVLLAGVAVAVLLMRDKPAMPPADPPKVADAAPGKTTPSEGAPTPTQGATTPTTGTAPTQGATTPTTPATTPTAAPKTTFSLIPNKGKLSRWNVGTIGFFPDAMATRDRYLGVANSTAVKLFQINSGGSLSLMAEYALKDDWGPVKTVAVGDYLNDKNPSMIAVFEKKLLVLPDYGDPKVVDVAGLENLLIGDYDGDGKTETILLTAADDGTYGFEVWKYPADNWTYRKEGRKEPWPALMQTDLKEGDRNLLLGYAIDGDKFYFDLYRWDGLNGPTLISSFETENSDAAPPEWIAAGPTNLGPMLALVRGGAQRSVEVFAVSADGKSHRSLGTFAAELFGKSAVVVGDSPEWDSLILTVDETGHFTSYELAK